VVFLKTNKRDTPGVCGIPFYQVGLISSATGKRKSFGRKRQASSTPVSARPEAAGCPRFPGEGQRQHRILLQLFDF